MRKRTCHVKSDIDINYRQYTHQKLTSKFEAFKGLCTYGEVMEFKVRADRFNLRFNFPISQLATTVKQTFDMIKVTKQA